MDLQAALRARLKAVAALNTPTGGRIDWGTRPVNTGLPALVLTKVAPGQEWTHEGPNALVRPWVQVDIWAASGLDAATLAGALQAEMQRLDPVTVGGWLFLPPGTLENDQWPGPEDLDGGGRAHRVIHEYRFYAQPAE
jgi:hypothetical protein